MGDEDSNLEVSCHFKNNCSQKLGLNLTIHLLQVNYLEMNKQKIKFKIFILSSLALLALSGSVIDLEDSSVSALVS